MKKGIISTGNRGKNFKINSSFPGHLNYQFFQVGLTPGTGNGVDDVNNFSGHIQGICNVHKCTLRILTAIFGFRGETIV